MPVDMSRISQELQIRRGQVESTVQLLDEGNTVPFITRYRKERTGGLDEEAIRAIQARVTYLRQLAERKQTILKSIEGQGKLTDELRAAILAAESSKRLEDLYLPFKPKKRSLATTARERGLEALALAIWNKEPAVANLAEVLPGMVNPEKELATADDVLTGVGHILAEIIAETADVRAAVRVLLWETGKLTSAKSETLAEGQGLEYKDYFQFAESVKRVPAHRILAINRGEKVNALKVQIERDLEAVKREALAKLPLVDHPHAEFLNKVAEDAIVRLLLPSLEREIRRELADEAGEHAVRIFARNLRSLLMQPPLRGQRVLAIDPGFRTGCKIAALDEIGNILEHGVIYPYARTEKKRPRLAEKPAEVQPGAESVTPPAEAPASSATPVTAPSVDAPAPPLEPVTTPPAEAPTATVEPASAEPVAVSVEQAVEQPKVETPGSEPPPPAPQVNSRNEAKTKLAEMVNKHALKVVAIGNGTACRETEELVAELIAELLPNLAYVIVNEAGASVYSASAVGREEFPEFDATLRGTVSIGRRLQDPLSELVKIEPQSIGVGLYQHDIQLRRLKESLESVVESCVNSVGVDVNTASVSLLRYVSGLNQLAARELVDFRKRNGPFKNREQLRAVPGIGPNRFVQAAGFLKISGGDNPLDQSWIHPESYPTTLEILREIGLAPEDLNDKEKRDSLREKSRALHLEELSARSNVGQPTLRDILDALVRPGRDPREELPPPIFKKGILKLEDLKPEMELKGTVLNVVDFGAFVDIGLKDSGLVHISQLANRFVKNAYEVVAVGDVVTVWVLSIDQERKRVSLTMIKPGTDRKPPERRPPENRGQPASGPPQRGRRPPPRRAPVPARPQPAQAATQTAPPSKPVPRPAVAQQPPPRPRKPQRQPPKPNLSQAALEGEAPLRTFSELMAFFEAQKQPPAKKPEDPPPAPNV
jgi:transcriptional accessory protein Tex/SPT6